MLSKSHNCKSNQLMAIDIKTDMEGGATQKQKAPKALLIVHHIGESLLKY